MSKIKKATYNNEEQSSLSCTSSSLSSDDEVDVQDLKPIKDYISDRKELAHQLFKSVKLEKIRMMLPQTLKQIDLEELKQWCVSELSGMSKKRILSILNGKLLLESSNTSESDDSGPSLEIISDTEEWLTDDDTFKKEDNDKGKLKRDKNKIKGKTQVNKKISSDKSNAKATCSNKNKKGDNDNDIKIKKENDKEKAGDSLLDLLELEMRARAIRALIRKEEDVIPGSVNSSQTNNSETIEKDVKSLPPDDIKAKEDCRKQLEKIINVKQVNIGEDEDVVLVVQPTPVVELLSSDSDKDDGGTRINKKLENERVKKTVKSAENNNENSKDSIKDVQDLKERKIIALNSTVNKIDVNTKNEGQIKIPERNVDIKNNILSISISADNIAEKRKKSKKKSREKSQLISSLHNTNEKASKVKKIDTNENHKQTHDIKVEEINMQATVSPISNEKQVNVEEEVITKKTITSKKSRIEKEKLEELEEIIDLDDYCDDMDIENCDEDKVQEEDAVCSQQENKLPISQSQSTLSPQKSDSLETWASRYYQTDDVQNVIKESKIQSEIRKRLRERQRLSKLRNSPNISLSSQTSTSTITNPTDCEKIPTGSVEEYLALKRTMSTTADSNNSDNNINTILDNTVTLNSESDVGVKESLMQNENISSGQECTDNINNTKETVTLKTAETTQEISDTKNNT